jgi:hypothetical protein
MLCRTGVYIMADETSRIAPRRNEYKLQVTLTAQIESVNRNASIRSFYCYSNIIGRLLAESVLITVQKVIQA